MQNNKVKVRVFLSVIILTSVVLVTLFFSCKAHYGQLVAFIYGGIVSPQTTVDADKQINSGYVLYRGNIDHIFFHSLIIYPDLAYNSPKADLYKKFMITVDEFKKILPELYKNNFVLIDISSIYSVNKDGSVVQKPLYLPKNKKPLIISVDDLSYYKRETGHGFADKLVLNQEGKVLTQVITPSGQATTTDDGDVVPILDSFVATHPDFSINGAKGLIALTGFEGVLGYRTQATVTAFCMADWKQAKNVIDKLKATGWSFASHSYTHESSFFRGDISLDTLKKDTAQWKTEVEPLIGITNIFVGPFGQIFGEEDPRRTYLVDQGFKMFCGVGVDHFLHYYNNHIVMDRADIDGYRISKNPNLLRGYFDNGVVSTRELSPVIDF